MGGSLGVVADVAPRRRDERKAVAVANPETGTCGVVVPGGEAVGLMLVKRALVCRLRDVFEFVREREESGSEVVPSYPLGRPPSRDHAFEAPAASPLEDDDVLTGVVADRADHAGARGKTGERVAAHVHRETFGEDGGRPPSDVLRLRGPRQDKNSQYKNDPDSHL